MEIHLAEHLLTITRQAGASLISLALLALAFFFAARRWQEKPRLLRISAAGFLPLGFLFIFFGFPFEIGVFYEFFMVGVLLCLDGMKSLFARARLQLPRS